MNYGLGSDDPEELAYYNKIIDKTTVYLMNNWDSDKSLKGIYPPQVINTNTGTKVYGGCGDYKTGISEVKFADIVEKVGAEEIIKLLSKG